LELKYRSLDDDSLALEAIVLAIYVGRNMIAFDYSRNPLIYA
jgi:hypothetical protein